MNNSRRIALRTYLSDGAFLSFRTLLLYLCANSLSVSLSIFFFFFLLAHCFLSFFFFFSLARMKELAGWKKDPGWRDGKEFFNFVNIGENLIDVAQREWDADEREAVLPHEKSVNGVEKKVGSRFDNGSNHQSLSKAIWWTCKISAM